MSVYNRYFNAGLRLCAGRVSNLETVLSRDRAVVLQDRRSKLAEVRTMMSSVDDRACDGAGVSAPRVGADLCAARERLGWSLPAIALHLRIRQPFLEAIEGGRIGELPGNNAYAVGFVRTYAQSLGLDPDEIARRFRSETADVNRKTELTFPVPVPERGVPAGAVVLLGVVLSIGAYVGWYRMSGDGRQATAVKQVPAHLAPLIEPVKPPAAPSVPAPAEAPAAAVPPAPAVSPSSAAAAIPAPGAVPGPTAAAISSITPAPAPAPAPAPDGTRIMLRARADAWVQVRDRQGPVLLNRIMRNGETWSVPAKGQLLLTTGNAGGTELLVDGVLAPSLGGDGAVRRDLPLDPDLIRDGKLTPATAATQGGAAKPSGSPKLQ
jgi:cytoskeleton protein RodZ